MKAEANRSRPRTTQAGEALASIEIRKDPLTQNQYGVTGGGNDGAVFTRFGSVDVAMGWPLRYSHSPAEVIDTRDLDALSRIVTVIAKSW